MNPVRNVLAIMTEIGNHIVESEKAIEDPALAERLVAAVREMDLALTGKVECRNHDRDLERAVNLLERWDHWEVYLSDGGYSRVWLDPMGPFDKGQAMWIARGDPMTCGSRLPVVEKYDAMMAEEELS